MKEVKGLLEDRRTIGEWGRQFEVIVKDPDGFDRKDRHLMCRKFTREEFEKGMLRSTLEWTGQKSYFGSYPGKKPGGRGHDNRKDSDR